MDNTGPGNPDALPQTWPQDAAERLREVSITQVANFWHTTPRPKLVGKNAYHDVHGSETLDFFIRIATDCGVEGVGPGRTTLEKGQSMVGCTLDQFLHPELGIVSPLGGADSALYDLVGKVLNVPSWQLLGAEGPEWISIYDSSIYFNDLLPENESRGVKALLKEVETSLQQGHRAFKIKIGRGAKWMDRRDGFRRDVEVVRAIRAHVGKDVRLMVDANNSYDLETTRNLLDAAGDDFLFLEEMFPEEIIADQELKTYLRKRRSPALVADGESATCVQDFEDFIACEALDVLQPDIRVFGLSMARQLSQQTADTPIRLATHNWGSWLALFPQLTLGRGISNMLIAEHDPGGSDLFDVSAYTFSDGSVRVPDLPGSGIQIREEKFRQIYGQNAWRP